MPSGGATYQAARSAAKDQEQDQRMHVLSGKFVERNLTNDLQRMRPTVIEKQVNKTCQLAYKELMPHREMFVAHATSI